MGFVRRVRHERWLDVQLLVKVSCLGGQPAWDGGSEEAEHWGSCHTGPIVFLVKISVVSYTGKASLPPPVVEHCSHWYTKSYHVRDRDSGASPTWSPCWPWDERMQWHHEWQLHSGVTIPILFCKCTAQRLVLGSWSPLGLSLINLVHF